MIVDDEDIVLRSLKAELKETVGDAYRIDVAETAEEALEIVDEVLAEESDFPLVIADYIMPGMKGDELLIRIHSVSPRTLKIMLTGQADTQAVGNAVNEAKLYRYIAKPWEQRDLSLTIGEAIRSYFLDKKLAQQNLELKELNESLEDKVAQRTEELSNTLEDLKSAQTRLVQSAKMAALGKLVAGIAHEINTPISVVYSSVNVAKRCLEIVRKAMEESESLEQLRDDNRFQKALKALGESGQLTGTASERIAKLVKSLKNFARLDEAEFQHVDIHDGIESTLAVAQHELGDRIEVVKRYGRVPKIPCYPGELNQVFLDLIMNATKAIDGEGSICITTSVDDDLVCVKIADTGRGIASDELDNLFDFKFTSKAGRVGMGMGLSTVNHVIHKHHGEIHVDSSVGKGTEFTIRLPIGPIGPTEDA